VREDDGAERWREERRSRSTRSRRERKQRETVGLEDEGGW
jgi:hypothetical protein